MKLLGRDISRYWRRIPEIPAYFGYFYRCFRLFSHPAQFILAYLRPRSLPSRVVELRSGIRIHLSEHPHDIISVFVVFVREDYGRIEPDTTVVDVGANIGIFSLYAAQCQAARVLAYEPNAESYSLLLRNIQANRLEQCVIAERRAVVGNPGDRVRFPVKSSMYNAIVTEDSRTDFEWVDTIGLGEIVSQEKEINLLKLDCEGAEYDILDSADEDIYAEIQHIRLEYHSGGEAGLDDNLSRYGFVRSHHSADTATSGSLWYEKESSDGLVYPLTMPRRKERKQRA